MRRAQTKGGRIAPPPPFAVSPPGLVGRGAPVGQQGADVRIATAEAPVELALAHAVARRHHGLHLGRDSRVPDVAAFLEGINADISRDGNAKTPVTGFANSPLSATFNDRLGY